MREVKRLCAAIVRLSVNTVLVVAARILLNAVLRFKQKHGTRPVNDGASRADGGAAGLQAFGNPMIAEFALGDARVVSHPLETRDVVGACNCAVAAPNAVLGSPADDSCLRVFME